MIMYSKQKGHMLFKDCLDSIIRFEKYELHNNDVVNCTGPKLLTSILKKYEGEVVLQDYDYHIKGYDSSFRPSPDTTGNSWNYQQYFGIYKKITNIDHINIPTDPLKNKNKEIINYMKKLSYTDKDIKTITNIKR